MSIGFRPIASPGRTSGPDAPVRERPKTVPKPTTPIRRDTPPAREPNRRTAPPMDPGKRGPGGTPPPGRCPGREV